MIDIISIASEQQEITDGKSKLVRQQAITQTNVDQVLHHHKRSLEVNELTHCGLVMPYGGRDIGQHWFR